MFSVAVALAPFCCSAESAHIPPGPVIQKMAVAVLLFVSLLLLGVVEEFVLGGQQAEKMTGEVSKTCIYTYRKM